MSLLKSTFWKKLLTILLCMWLTISYSPLPALAGDLPLMNNAIAQLPQFRVLTTSQLLQSQPPTFASLFSWFRRKPKRKNGAPTQTGSAGRRGQCNALNQSFIAFVPATKSPGTEATMGVGFTINQQPTVLVYLPDLPESPTLMVPGNHAQLMIQQLQGDEEVDLLKKTIELPIPSHGGLTAISFEKLGVTLEPDQAYHWYLSIICDLERPSRNPSVDAWVELVGLNEMQAIKTQVAAIPDNPDKIEFYLVKEIWHEPVMLLTRLRCQNPQNAQYTAELTELLTAVLPEGKLKKTIADVIRQQRCPTEL